MPLFDVVCPQCGPHDDVLVRREALVYLPGERESRVPCPSCGSAAPKRTPVVNIPQVTDTRTLRVGGREFSSAKAADRWADQNNQVIVTPGSSTMRDLHDYADGAAHHMATSSGFRDYDDYRARAPQEAQERACEAGERAQRREALADDAYIDDGGETVFDVSKHADNLKKEGLD